MNKLENYQIWCNTEDGREYIYLTGEWIDKEELNAELLEKEVQHLLEMHPIGILCREYKYRADKNGVNINREIFEACKAYDKVILRKLGVING